MWLLPRAGARLPAACAGAGGMTAMTASSLGRSRRAPSPSITSAIATTRGCCGHRNFGIVAKAAASAGNLGAARDCIVNQPWEVMLCHHRRETMDTTRALCDSLRSQGVNVFWDIESDPEQILGSRILDVAKRVPVLVCVTTENTLDLMATESDWVRQEISAAVNTGGCVVPYYCSPAAQTASTQDTARLNDAVPRPVLSAFAGHKGSSILDDHAALFQAVQGALVQRTVLQLGPSVPGSSHPMESGWRRQMAAVGEQFRRSGQASKKATTTGTSKGYVDEAQRSKDAPVISLGPDDISSTAHATVSPPELRCVQTRLRPVMHGGGSGGAVRHPMAPSARIPLCKDGTEALIGVLTAEECRSVVQVSQRRA